MTIKLWDMQTLSEKETLKHPDFVRFAAFSPNGEMLATICANTDDVGYVKVFDVATARELLPSPKAGRLGSLAFSPDSKLLATYSGVTVKVWDLSQKRLIARLSRMRHEEIIHAQENGILDVSVYGEGLDSVVVVLKSKLPEPIEIGVMPGTLFRADTPNIQNMVATEESALRLEPFQEKPVRLQAACINMLRRVPKASDRLAPEKTPIPEDLLRLVTSPGFNNLPFRIQQFAIWTITDNPQPHGYVPIGTQFYNNGPTTDEFATIRNLFKRVGLSADKYHALRTN
jgi:hypothetical protein